MVNRFLSALLRANRHEQDAFYARQIPLKVFVEARAECRWVFEYRNRHREYPSVAAFKQRFPNFDLPKVKESLAAVLQAQLDKHTFEQVGKIFDKSRELHIAGRNIGDVVAFMRRASSEIMLYDTDYTDLNIGELSLPYTRYRNRLKERAEGHISHAPSPWNSLNQLQAYSEWGEHNVIASRTSIGKTWIALYWANYFRQMGERVLFVSKEMPTHQIADRLECLMFKLPYVKFRRGELPPSLLGRWKRERRRFKSAPFYITGHETMTGVGFNHILTKIDQYKPTVLFVDGAYLIYPEDMPRNASPVDRFTRISNMMKRICLAKHLIGFSAIQVRRDGSENKEGETNASLKDIYGADAWAQDADNVLLVSGKRGAPVRRLTLGKGRESNVGEFTINFKLEPQPDFGEARGFAMRQAGSTVSFVSGV